MNARHLVIFCLAALTAIGSVGCRTDPNLALLERELRGQEYEIDELDNLLQDYQLALNSCRRENATLRKQLPAGGGGLKEQADSAGGLNLPPGIARPSSPLDAGLLNPPSVELPQKAAPEGQPPPASRLPDALEVPDAPVFPAAPGKPRSAPKKESQRVPTPGATSATPADSSRVHRIVVNDLLIGGRDADGRHPAEGIAVVIEPRDADGRPTAAAAPISVVALDPALPGQAARVGRWDFTAEQAAAMYRRTPSGEGIHLEMAWPAAPPVHRRLDLFVRYTTADGRKLEAHHTVNVNLNERQFRSWTSVDPLGPAAATPRSKTPWQGAPSVASQQPPPKPALTAARPATTSPPSGRTAGLLRPAWSPHRP